MTFIPGERPDNISGPTPDEPKKPDSIGPTYEEPDADRITNPLPDTDSAPPEEPNRYEY